MKSFKKILLWILFKFITIPFQIGLFVVPMLMPMFLSIIVVVVLGTASGDSNTLVEQILARFGISLNNEVSIADEIVGYNSFDLSPFPKEKTACEEGCKCELKDYRVKQTTKEDGTQEFEVLKETEVLNRSEGLLMDWVYTGWTYLDQDHWDIDFSKFSNREPENLDKEYLFKWGVNRMNSKGRNIFSFESSSTIKREQFDETIDESTRDGSFVLSKGEFKHVDTRTNKEWMQRRQYLDLGKLMVLCDDYRITSAFAPMITTGDGGFANLLRARQWFHKGDVWNGREESFSNGRLNLWQDDVGRGAYIDVVFEDENNCQFVIPFVYKDAKNVHWFKGAGQQVDQRYGQVHVKRQQANDNGTYHLTNTIYSATWEVIGRTQEDEAKFQAANKQFADISIVKANSYQNLNYHLSSANIKEGETVQNLAGDQNVFDFYVFYGQDKSNNPAILKLSNFQKTTEEDILGYYLSDNDTLMLQSMSSIEIMFFYYDREVSNTGQDFNHFLMNYLLRGEQWEGASLNHWPECRIVGMRVYPNAHKDEKKFAERRKEFQAVNELPANNRVVEYCGPECKCNICSGVAR